MRDWLQKLSSWGHSLLGSRPIVAIRPYVEQTIAYTRAQYKLIPHFKKTLFTREATPLVLRHLARIALADIWLLIVIQYAYQCLYEKGQQKVDDLKKEETTLSMISIQMIYSGLWVVQAGVWAYGVSRQTQFMVRTLIVTLEAPILFNQDRASPPMTICQEAGCSPLQFVHGSIRDLVTYWSTEVGLAALSYVPVMGVPLSSALGVYHRGRYVLTVALPEVCHRHQIEYLQEHSELALSLGIVQTLITVILNTWIELNSGISQEHYEKAIAQLTLILQMGIAVQLALPRANARSTRTLPDPILMFQQVVGFTFDTLLCGLITRLQNSLLHVRTNQLMNTLKQRIPWSPLLYGSARMWQHPMAKMLLPGLLHDLKHFIHDPIVRTHWPALQARGVAGLKMSESLLRNPVIQHSRHMSRVVGKLIQTLFGMPRVVTTLLLQAITDPDMLTFITRCRVHLEQLHLSDRAGLLDEDTVLVASIRRMPPHLTPEQIAGELSEFVDPTAVIVEHEVINEEAPHLAEDMVLVERPNVGEGQAMGCPRRPSVTFFNTSPARTPTSPVAGSPFVMLEAANQSLDPTSPTWFPLP